MIECIENIHKMYKNVRKISDDHEMKIYSAFEVEVVGNPFFLTQVPSIVSKQAYDITTQRL